jgi:phosphoserine phosphatase
VRALCATLRAEDRAEIEAVGLVPRHALIALWRASIAPRVAIVDGEVAAAWGDTAQLLSDTGSLWAFTAAPVARLPLAFLRETRKEVRMMLGSRQVLRAHVACSYQCAIRFFSLAGFSVGDPQLIAGAVYRELRIERGT